MSVEMRNGASLIRETAERAKQGGYPKQAEWLLQQAEAFDREAALLEEVDGPKYFLPQEEQSEAPSAAPTEPSLVIPSPARLTTATFRDQLYEELKGRGQEVALSEPSAEIVEFYHILASEGYEVAPHVYVDGRKATYAVLERVVRPEYTNGTQMYYANPDGSTNDPLAGILEKGRKGRKINITDWTKHVPYNSRFGLSWDEIDQYVAPEVAKRTPALATQMTNGGIVLHVPTKAEFQSAGKQYPHFGQANTWEWVYDGARFGRRLFAGDRVRGGVFAVDDWPSGARAGSIAFRLQGKSPSQKLPW